MHSILRSFQQLISDIKKLAATKFDLYRSQLTLLVSDLAAELVYSLLMIMIFIFFLVFASGGFALLIGSIVGNLYYGFFTLGIFYAFAGIICFLLRKKILKILIRNWLINKMVKS